MSKRQDPEVKQPRWCVVVPSSTDRNLGDQALVWEAVSAIEDMGLADTIMLFGSAELSDDDADRELERTQRLGYRILRPILAHPRRSRYKADDKVKDSVATRILMISNALRDFISNLFVLLVAPYPRLLKLLLGNAAWETYLAIKSSHVIVVKGGGFLHSYGGLTAWYTIWYFLFYIRLAHRLHRPVVVLPNSFGPFKGLGVKGQMRNILALCAFISARETRSGALLEEVIGKSVPVYPDMGYYLRPAPVEFGEVTCKRFGVPLGAQPCVAFTVRPYRFPGRQNPEEMYSRYLDAVAELIKHVVQKGFYPVLVTHVTGPSPHENDRLAIEDLRTRLRGIQHSWIDFDADCREIKSVYGCMDFLVGTRFHSVIFAQGCGVPSLAIAYGGNKAIGIMHDMGLDDYVIPIENVDPADLCSRFDKMVAEADAIKARMSEWIKECEVRRTTMLAEIREAVQHFYAEEGDL